MTESSDEGLCGGDGPEESSWVLYKNRKDWCDVIPVAQDDGPHPVVAIAYSEKFRDAFDYFRAILKSGEKSERALVLTKDCIWLNPANYTVWHCRRDILKALGKDLNEELKYIDDVILDNSKNYQVWQHRKLIVEWMQDPSVARKELDFTENIFKTDAKNYHAWLHRQWCIKTFDLFDTELAYVEYLLDKDVRNNSAWNQRYFVLSHTTLFEQDVIDREINFALHKIDLVKRNESAWNYLRGILEHDSSGLAYNMVVRKKFLQLYSEGCRVNHLLACIIDICQEKPINEESPDSIFHIDYAMQLCRDLSEKHDTMRKRYWDFIHDKLLQKLIES